MTGPLYHWPEPSDRRLALREALRVLRPGGVIAAVAINRAANLIGSTLANTLLDRRGIVEDIRVGVDGEFYRAPQTASD